MKQEEKEKILNKWRQEIRDTVSKMQAADAVDILEQFYDDLGSIINSYHEIMNPDF